jgi:hypothetical protein
MPAEWQLARYNRALIIGLGLERMGNASYDDFRRGRRELAGRRDAVAETFYEDLAVRIAHDLDNRRVIEGDAEPISEGFLEFPQ